MRILLINQYYAPDTAATGQLLKDVACGLVREGHEVHVLCSRRMYGGESRILANEICEDVRVHRVRATGFGRSASLGRILDWMSFHFAAAFRAMFLPTMQACVCLTTPPLIGVVGLMLRRVRGTRLIIWSMDLYPEIAVVCGYLRPKGAMTSVVAFVNKRLYKAASCIISLGDNMTERLIEAGADADKIVLVHNWAPGESSVVPIDSGELLDSPSGQLS